MAVLEIVQHGLRQAEIRNTVAQHAANLILAFKNGHLIAVPRQDDRDGQPRGTGAYDGTRMPLDGAGPFTILVLYVLEM